MIHATCFVNGFYYIELIVCLLNVPSNWMVAGTIGESRTAIRGSKR